MNIYQAREKLMGSAFELIVVAENQSQGNEWLQTGITEIRRIEELLSEFKPDSVISRLNQEAGKRAVAVPDEVYDLILRCKHLYKITGGTFDITVGLLKRLYNFKNEVFVYPDPGLVRETLKITGSHRIELQPENSIFLKKENMKISLAAIGKGYAADCVRRLWKMAGVPGGVVNASGDLAVLGAKPEGESWVAGIPHPDDRQKIILYLSLNGNAIATSGDYEQFFIREGRRYSHTINPKNGLPLSGVKSVSVTSPSAELSDALATAVYVMGIKKGLAFINRLPDTYAIFVDENNEVHFSKKIKVRKK